MHALTQESLRSALGLIQFFMQGSAPPASISELRAEFDVGIPFADGAAPPWSEEPHALLTGALEYCRDPDEAEPTPVQLLGRLRDILAGEVLDAAVMQ